MLTVAAAPLRMPKAFTTPSGIFSCGRLMLKLPSERCVCAPQYFEFSTSTGPKASDSVLVLAILMVCNRRTREGYLREEVAEEVRRENMVRVEETHVQIWTSKDAPRGKEGEAGS